MFPAGFRALGLGKLVGTPTMGAVIGTGSYSLIDGSTIRTPTVGVYLGDAVRTNMENYGVQPDMAQRSREIGVRMALGAQRGDVSRMVLRHGLRLAAVGAGVGLVAAFLLTQLMAALLFGVEPLDPATYGAAGVGAALLALAASWVPARRAARVDPIETLH
jgi:predicted lysophospholipase L1 biosynthesis ABC-type transport system permease subunit